MAAYSRNADLAAHCVQRIQLVAHLASRRWRRNSARSADSHRFSMT